MELFGRIRLFRRDQEDWQRRRPPLPPPLMFEKSRVARQLFGTPDHEENMKFVREELAKNQKEARERWNFDFANDKPIPGRFQWEVEEPCQRKENRDPESDDDDSTTAVAALPSSSPRASLKQEEEDEEPVSEKLSVVSDQKKQPTDSCSSTKRREPCMKPSLVCDTTVSHPSECSPQRPARQRQSRITGHFTQRKRSKSKVKTQERKECDEYDTAFTQPT